MPPMTQNTSLPTRLTDTNLLEHLLQISRKLAEIRDTPTFLNCAVDEVLRLVGAERGYIVLINENVVRPTSSIEELLSEPDAIEFQVRRRNDGTDIDSDVDLISRSILTQVFVDRRSLLIKDALTNMRFASVESVIELQLRSIMCVPLIFQNELLGAIYVENRTLSEQFSTENLIPLEYFSHQAAVVVARIKLDSEHQRLQQQYFQSQKMEALGQLSGGIAHDFNNLLVPIIAYVELSKKLLPKGDQIHEYLENIHDSSLRATRLIRQILTYSRKKVLDPAPVDVGSIVSKFDSLLEELLEDGIEVDMKIESAPSVVMGDKSQIEQILLNLVINARDAMEGTGKLTIETSVISRDRWRDSSSAERFYGGEPPPENYVVLRVHDTGHGIDDEKLNLIFEPFFTTKGQDEGTGLGLSTVFGVVQQHNGYISVESRLEGGTIFSVYLPQTIDDVMPNADEVRHIVPTASSILIVDDNDTVRNAISQALTESTYAVYEASTPQEVIAVFTENKAKINLVLTDLMMPESNGYELSQQVAEINPDVKFLYMSGYSDRVLAKYGITKDEINYIQKPFSIDELVNKINEIMLAE